MNAAAREQLSCWCQSCPHMPRYREIMKEGKPFLAERALRAALLDAPRCPEINRALAHHLNQHNRAAAAIWHLTAARGTIGLTPALALEIATTLRNAAKIPEAIAASRRALLLNADNAQAYVALAAALQADGQVGEACDLIAEARKKLGERKEFRRIEAVLLADQKDYLAAIARLTADDLEPLEYFDRGRFHEARGEYAAAWSDWMAGKQIQRDKFKMVYPAAAIARRFADLHEIARPPRLDYLHRCIEPGPRPWPLFITGFPRSGTTMIEAALTAHPLIAAGDELAFLPELIERVPSFLSAPAPYPRALMATAFPENAGATELMRDFYTRRSVAKIGNAAMGAAYFSDKMPSNEMHWLLIAMLFPSSPIVHVRRHPLDILISNMSHNLIHGSFNACDLEWCATHYALCDNLVDHYRRKLKGFLKLREVRYEVFVADHRAGIDALLPPDLAPDLRCYDFHESPWHSRTISHRQIKEPVHDKSVGRYRPFLDFLKPIVPIVQATLDREGYSL